MVKCLTQDLRTFTGSCLQLGLSGTGTTMAWAATAEARGGHLLSNSFASSTHKAHRVSHSPASSPLCDLASLQPQAKGLLACHWNSKTIHSPLWRLFFSKEIPGTYSALWWPVLSALVTKISHSLSGSMI